MSRLFGTDGVRGVAVTELTCEMAMNIGKALATLLIAQQGDGGEGGIQTPNIIVGKDTRISSDILESALVAGITACGGDAQLVGIVPTPAVAYFTRKYEADAGVMITASHNPAEFNGIKLFNREGFKFPDEIEDYIEGLVRAPESIPLKEGKEVGSIFHKATAVSDYCWGITEFSTRTIEGLKVLIDCANGSASFAAGQVFSGLGAECVLIHNSPNGININDRCGSTYIDDLAKQVVEGKFDIGIAFDGDADRMLAVDERGNYVDGDKIIALLSAYLRQKGKLASDTVVVTVMSNMGFHQYMKQNGLKTVTVPVGDRYVVEKMFADNCSIGGEQSGHIIFKDCSTTGDGIITAIKTLNMLKDRAVPLSTLVSQIPTFPQVLRNVTISADKKGQWESNAALTGVIEQVKAASAGNSRVLIRESGTEPLLRVMIEGQQQAQIDAWAEQICTVAQQELS
ncbi:MAG: phosphoglucosamine mutase [Oscillospiraceae bacterium]|nr:phosphoglucosamine mutase [Oscillospiraceae bacterium]